MRIRQALYFLIFSLSAAGLSQAQLVSAPEPQKGAISGFTADIDDAAVPGAVITIDGPTSAEHYVDTADEVGFFELANLKPAQVYHITVTAKGFAPLKLPDVTLLPGQVFELKGIKLIPADVESVSAESAAEVAMEEVHEEEQQRILGIIPNFYVVYDSDAPALSTKLKYQLALKSSIDVVTFASAAFLAGINQAADTPAYVQGFKGYSQRFGAAYTDGVSDVLLGGAIYPAMFHQDPRYFYQGIGTKKARFMHAIESPFICRGDNGHNQFNISSVLGDLTSGALSNIYYPPADRGAELVFGNALITTGGRMVNALAQEFILNRLTTHGKQNKKKK